MQSELDSNDIIDFSRSIDIAAWNDLSELKEQLLEGGEGNSTLYCQIGERLMEWLYFHTRSHKIVENNLTQRGPKIDGVHALVTVQKWYHVWARRDGEPGNWAVKRDVNPKDLEMIANAIRVGYLVPVIINGAGKTIYWLQRSS